MKPWFLLLLVGACTTNPLAPEAPKAPSPTSVQVTTDCEDWTVWGFYLDGVRWDHPGALWGLAAKSTLVMETSPGAHQLRATRWSPTIREVETTVTTLKPYALPCT